jgi:hypothetical protein
VRYFILMIAAATAAISISKASAATRITGDRGGQLINYVERFTAARVSGERIIIDGPCLSACTLVIAMLPRGQICATPNAVLGFHAAWRPTTGGRRVRVQTATQLMYESYPSKVRNWIDRNGGLSERMIFLTGSELAEMVPICNAHPTSTGTMMRSNKVSRSGPVARDTR